jgi:hypothetical protein
MGWTIEIEATDYQRLREHLMGEVEQVAFLFTEPYSGDCRLRVRDLRLLSSDGFDFQSGYHVELADEIRPEVIKRAWDEDACLIEAHSHVRGPAGFSPSDLWGFEEWVPHVRWRLGGRPYVALVFAPNDFDALVWDGEGSPVPLEAMDIIGGQTLQPASQPHPAPKALIKESKKSWWRKLRGK